MRKIVAACTLPFVFGIPLFGLTACKDVGQTCKYEIEAEYVREEGKLEGSMRVSVPNNTENALEEIPFALYANCFREGAKTPSVSDLYEPAVFYDGTSYGGIQIEEVTGGADWKVGGEDENLLLVRLSEPLYPDERVTLSVRYALTLPKANHRFGIGESCVNLSCFYPQVPAQNESGFYGYTPSPYGDPFVLDRSDFSVKLTVPEDMTAACGGAVSESAENGKRVYRCNAEGVRDAAFVLGNLTLSSTERDGVKIDYYHFGDGAPEETLKAASDAIAAFSELFCDYPFKRYAFAETDLGFGGMEYGGFSMISSALRKEERAEVVVHETAHQWWYAAVGNDEVKHAWLDEGLTEYSTMMFYEKNTDGYKFTLDGKRADALSAYILYCETYKNNGLGDTSMTRPVNEYATATEYAYMTYVKGALMFDDVRNTIGDAAFKSALKTYYNDNKFGIAEPQDLIGAMEKASKRQLSALFEAWLDGNVKLYSSH